MSDVLIYLILLGGDLQSLVVCPANYRRSTLHNLGGVPEGSALGTALPTTCPQTTEQQDPPERVKKTTKIFG